VGMLNARTEGPRAGEGFLGRGLQLGGLGGAVSSSSGVRGGAPENFEFGALGDLKIASKQCKMMFFC